MDYSRKSAVGGSNQASACNHSSLISTTSSHADVVGYRRTTDQQRAIAAGRKEVAETESEYSFPAPLLLPGDDLSFDPRCPQQSFRSWLRLKERNEVTNRRNTLYIAGPPRIDSDADFVRLWSTPTGDGRAEHAALSQPHIQDVVDYLTAFYHGVQMKILPPDDFRFTKWEEEQKGKSKSGPQFVGLSTTTETVRVRVRSSLDGVFQGQLNLDDLLDTAISALPGDAFALLMLVDHDLFEDEDDDFCCGRAYGGSRVAVVSTARYNPWLDCRQDVEKDHAWPASHCEAYVQSQCKDNESGPARKSSKKSIVLSHAAKPAKSSTSNSRDLSPANDTPLEAAVTAHKVTTLSDLSGLWLSRVCQTASHELGHCFGMDHCVSYACVMQSTSCLAEDVRQPPYLCPIDLAKVIRATSANELNRYQALLSFCQGRAHVPMFAAFGAWLRVRTGTDDLTKTFPLKPGSKDIPIEV